MILFLPNNTSTEYHTQRWGLWGKMNAFFFLISEGYSVKFITEEKGEGGEEGHLSHGAMSPSIV